MDLLEHAEEAQGYLEGVTFLMFIEDRKLQLVTQRLLEIIGEAAGHLSDETREAIPYDWKAVRGLRNILIHQYGSINPRALYQTATNDLPGLIERVRLALEETE